MPESSVKEVRLPELHLPELSRDDIVRALSEVHLPDVELPKVDIVTIRRRRIDPSSIDLGRALGGAAIIGRFVRPVLRRPRWPLAFGVLVALGLIGLGLSRSPAVRDGVDRATRRARERIDAMRTTTTQAANETTEAAASAIDPVASDVAEVMASAEETAEAIASPA